MVPSRALNIARHEERLRRGNLSREDYITARKLGFTDKSIVELAGDHPHSLPPVYKMVDTCAAEFSAATPYFYCIYETPESGAENEALEIIEKSKKERVLVLGSGPIRIGQGIEFDYASVHCVWSLKKMGYEVIVINNNPETVSTDFDTADRLYFEPLNIEDVMNVINIEKPIGVIVAFGGGTAIKLTRELNKRECEDYRHLGRGIDKAEDRERFDELLESLNIKKTPGLYGYDQAGGAGGGK